MNLFVTIALIGCGVYMLVSIVVDYIKARKQKKENQGE